MLLLELAGRQTEGRAGELRERAPLCQSRRNMPPTRIAGLCPRHKRGSRSVRFLPMEGGWRTTPGTTARHVIVHNLGGFVTLERAGGGSWQGEITAEDARNDLAVIRLDGHPAGAAPLWQQALTAPPAPGDALLIVGSPYGLSGTVTKG